MNNPSQGVKDEESKALELAREMAHVARTNNLDSIEYKRITKHLEEALSKMHDPVARKEVEVIIRDLYERPPFPNEEV